MAQYSQQKSARQAGAGDRRRFHKIARQVSATIGAEFFSSLVKHLSQALGADGVYIGEFVRGPAERVRTLAACLDRETTETLEFPLAGSPDAMVAIGNSCIYSRGVQELFPSDLLLSELRIEAYVGLPLIDSEGQANGLMVALYQHPLAEEVQFVQSMLALFAPRAAAELSRKQADDALRESHERYRAFIELNADAMWRLEFEKPIATNLPEEEQVESILQYGYLAECNVALARLVGVEKPEQLIGGRFDSLPAGSSASYREATRSMVRSGYRFSTIETTPVDDAGNPRYMLRTHWGIVENGMLQRIWGSTRDITEYRALEAQFRQSQKLDSIGKLAGGIAHDFNNLLTIIWGYSARLLENRDKTDPAYLGLVEIRRAAEKGAALTNQLLAFSRRRIEQSQLLNLSSVVSEDERMLRRLIGEHILLRTDLDPSLGLIRADVGHIHQVLMNLAVNARDAMPQGGKLIIALSNVDLDETRAARLSEIEPGRYVRLTVSDTGVGMSAEVQAHLFEPFFTTKEPAKGTGLGLSTVYGIVRQSGGHIVVETAPGKGTKFEIFLPRVTPSAVVPVQMQAPPAVHGGTETILLVEDEQELRALLGTSLRSLGYAVMEARSGAEALRLVRSHRGPLHLVVTDVVMPSMSGNELVERLKTVRPRHSDLKVLYITGYGDAPQEKAHPDSVSPYLRKPFPPEVFAAKVREILDERSTTLDAAAGLKPNP